MIDRSTVRIWSATALFATLVGVAGARWQRATEFTVAVRGSSGQGQLCWIDPGGDPAQWLRSAAESLADQGFEILYHQAAAAGGGLVAHREGRWVRALALPPGGLGGPRGLILRYTGSEAGGQDLASALGDLPVPETARLSFANQLGAGRLVHWQLDWSTSRLDIYLETTLRAAGWRKQEGPGPGTSIYAREDRRLFVRRGEGSVLFVEQPAL